MSARNWMETGISWLAETVKQGGYEVKGEAQIPQIVDLQLAIEFLGGDVVMKSLNGTSFRVSAQSVARSLLPKGVDEETMREAVISRLKGIRTRSVSTRIVKVYQLPGGIVWTGDDELEYQQAWAAAGVDQGMDAQVALQVATTMKF